MNSKKAKILILNRNARCELFINRSVQFYSHRYRQFITLRWLPCIKWLQVYYLSASIMWMSNDLSLSLISYRIWRKHACSWSLWRCYSCHLKTHDLTVKKSTWQWKILFIQFTVNDIFIGGLSTVEIYRLWINSVTGWIFKPYLIGYVVSKSNEDSESVLSFGQFSHFPIFWDVKSFRTRNHFFS